MTARHDNDLPEIRQRLADCAETLFERLFDKSTSKRGNQRRWGRKGSLVLYLRGRSGPHWRCYESRQGGDMLAAIQHALGLDFVGTLDWARDWLGMPRRETRQQRLDAWFAKMALRSAADRDDEPQRDELQPDRQRKPIDYDAEQAEKSRRAAELSATATPIAGTLAERYLREHRSVLA